jgi:hypothetical protein
MVVRSFDISPRTAHTTKAPLGMGPHPRKENHIRRLLMGLSSPGVVLVDAGQREQKSVILELMFVAIGELKARHLHWQVPKRHCCLLQHLLLLPPPLVIGICRPISWWRPSPS